MRKINMQEYETEILKSDKPVIIDFYADWCGPCRMISPIMEKLQKEHGEDVMIVKVDVDVQRALAGEFDIMSIPTIALINKGKVVEKVSGVRPISYYKSMLKKVM